MFHGVYYNDKSYKAMLSIGYPACTHFVPTFSEQVLAAAIVEGPDRGHNRRRGVHPPVQDALARGGVLPGESFIYRRFPGLW